MTHKKPTNLPKFTDKRQKNPLTACSIFSGFELGDVILEAMREKQREDNKLQKTKHRKP